MSADADRDFWRRVDMACPACGDSEHKAAAVLEALA